MPMELTVVDAFTDRPFRGNPAAVAVLDAFPDEARMQAVAWEMNLSETAFVARRPDDDHDLRWFTPTMEVDLCGHATLASAHVLGGAARFHTRSGVLACSARREGWIEMDFPADPVAAAPVPAGLAFEIDGMRAYGLTAGNALIELDSARAVREFVPDLAVLAALGTRAVIVTAAGDRAGIDCVSRVFAPNVGIAEDPVTGSAHCALAPYWGARLGRIELVGEQASARGGIVRMRIEGDQRVAIGGQAITAATVQLLV